MTADSILNPPENCTCGQPRIGIDNGRVYFRCGGVMVDGVTAHPGYDPNRPCEFVVTLPTCESGIQDGDVVTGTAHVPPSAIKYTAVATAETAGATK